ncbi:hypothetical protein [Sporisorium scitamineum]|uniref:Uncharacterized protein n=1 Tax=Sporisorium scitamineum TaxID=49012 RepID=A0A0F7S294_9BASI|nr:hypothetical protein [Sporisorium scitamineum]
MSFASPGSTLKRAERKLRAESRLCGVVSASLDRITCVKSCAMFSSIRLVAVLMLSDAVRTFVGEEREASVRSAALRACFSFASAGMTSSAADVEGASDETREA